MPTTETSKNKKVDVKKIEQAFESALDINVHAVSCLFLSALQMFVDLVGLYTPLESLVFVKIVCEGLNLTIIGILIKISLEQKPTALDPKLKVDRVSVVRDRKVLDSTSQPTELVGMSTFPGTRMMKSETK